MSLLDVRDLRARYGPVEVLRGIDTRIRKGEVVEAWKDIRVTDNLLRLLKNVVALSDKAEQMMWWGEVSIPNFVPYADLTLQIVLDWCWSSGVNKTEVEASATQALANLANPPVVQPKLPWAA